MSLGISELMFDINTLFILWCQHIQQGFDKKRYNFIQGNWFENITFLAICVKCINSLRPSDAYMRR